MINDIFGVPDGLLNQVGEGYAVLVTGVLVIAGWIVSARRSTHVHRREHTQKYLISQNATVELIAIRNFVVAREQVRLANLSAEEGKIVLQLMSRIERLAIEIAFGHLSERYIYATERSVLILALKTTRSFIADFRESPNGRKSTFEWAEILYIRFAYPRTSLVVRAVEWVFNKPLYALNKVTFTAKYWMASKMFGLAANHLRESPEDVTRALKLLHRCVIIPATLLLLLLIVHGAMRLSA